MIIPPDSSMETAADDIVFECELEAPLQKVWQVLTEPAYVAAWLLPGPADIPSSGPLSFDGRMSGLAGRVDCRLLTAEPPHRLRYAWREQDGDRALDSIVTFELDTVHGNCTHLRIVHGDFAMKTAAANSNETTMLLRAA